MSASQPPSWSLGKVLEGQASLRKPRKEIPADPKYTFENRPIRLWLYQMEIHVFRNSRGIPCKKEHGHAQPNPNSPAPQGPPDEPKNPGIPDSSGAVGKATTPWPKTCEPFCGELGMSPRCQRHSLHGGDPAAPGRAPRVITEVGPKQQLLTHQMQSNM